MDSCKAACCRALLCGIAVCSGSGYLYANASASADAFADSDYADVQPVAVTFFTEPANASLYSPSGGLYGAKPLTLYYEVPPTWDGRLQLEPLEAIWVSGAKSEVQLSACPENSHDQHYTFLRPDLAGADLDTWFAEKVDQLALVEEPASLSKNPAHAATEEPLSGNLVTCIDHGPSASGCR